MRQAILKTKTKTVRDKRFFTQVYTTKREKKIMQEFFSDVYLLRHFSQQKYWNRTKIMFVLLSIEIYKAVMYLARIYSW